jgi:outer membrane protein assembly factor BamE (lipoprotein component of BamABCDE complex)
MSGRRVRNALFLAIAVGIGYWIYKEKPTVSGIVDSITQPLFGSKAAVYSSERNRVRDEAGTVVAEQTDPTKVTTLKEGMTKDEIRDLLGRPDSVDKIRKEGVEQERWTYREARRVIVFQKNKVYSISVL